MSDLLSKPFLEGIFREAVAAVEPGRLVREALRSGAGPGGAEIRPSGGGRVFVVGGGKAGRAMGAAAAAWAGERLAAGIVAVPRAQGGSAGPVRFVEAGHPLPDEGSRAAAAEMVRLLRSAGEDDLVLALLSGGGSAMISMPPPGVSPEEKEEVLLLLLRGGLPIGEFNTVRKHLSAVKGGRMAAEAQRARLAVLVLSDVPGDDPSVVASGPFSPDPTTYADAMRVLVDGRLCAAIPAAAREHIQAGVAGRVPETPKPGDPVFARAPSLLVGSNRTALEAAAAAARRAGAGAVRLLPGFLRGEARECARLFARELLRARDDAGPGGIVLVAGGEATVTVSGSGRGGRSQEFVLAAAAELEGEAGLSLLAAGTDGVDGPTDAAGAYADGATCARGRAAGLSPGEHLARHDAYPFFAALADLVLTGPTGTNVADVALGAVRRKGP